MGLSEATDRWTFEHMHAVCDHLQSSVIFQPQQQAPCYPCRTEASSN